LSLPVAAHAGPRPDFNGDGYADLAVGAPGETIGATAYAGAVTIIYGSSDKLRGRGSQTFWLEHFGIASTAGALQLWSQKSAGVPGAPEAGDVFGAGRYGHR
jgi:hypothetical protein